MTEPVQPSSRPIADPDDLPPTFLDGRVDTALRSDGYVTLPVLDDDEVRWIAEAHRAMVGDDDRGMAVDYMRSDRGVITKFNELLTEVWATKFSEIFRDHRAVFSTCVVKHPGPDSAMFLHEDRSYVDERVARAGTLWIPLVDTGPEIDNGCLHVVPGSHRLASTFSGSNTPDRLRPYAPALSEALVPISVRAGHGLFYDTRTLHASPPNRTEHARPAIAVAVAPRSQALLHAVGTDVHRRSLYRVDEQFFINHGPEEIERQMPGCYDVIEELDEVADRQPAELVQRVCGLTEEPSAHALVPGDLLDLLAGRRSAPPSDVPGRIGALEPTIASTSATDGQASPVHGQLSDHDWIPASLWPGEDIDWRVGEPELQVVDATTRAIRLAPGQRLVLADGQPLEAVSAFEGSPLGCGVVQWGAAHHLPTGSTVSLGTPGPIVFWNHGPGTCIVLLRSSHQRSGARRFRFFWAPDNLQKRVQAMLSEVRAASRRQPSG